MNSVYRVLAVVALASACSDDGGTPSRPSPLSGPMSTATAPPLALAQVEIAGVVYEVTAAGRRPLSGVGIDMSVEYQSWPPQLTTGADGRYTFGMTSVATPPHGSKLIAEKAGYSQPCRVPVEDRPQHDIYLVSDDVLATAGLPASFPIVPPVLEGVVFEEAPEGRRPVAGASVVLDFTGGMGWAPSARTTTNADGRYVLCNVINATGFGFAALVRKPGYADLFLEVEVPPGTPFDIELRRLSTP